MSTPPGPERPQGQPRNQEQQSEANNLVRLIKRFAPDAPDEEIRGAATEVLGIVGQSVSQGINRARSREEAPSFTLPEGGLKTVIFRNADPNQIQDATVRRIVQGLSEEIARTQFDIFGSEIAQGWRELLSKVRQDAQDRVDTGGVAQIDRMLQNLDQVEQARIAEDTRKGQGREYGSVSLYLTPREIGEMSRSLRGARAVLERWISAIESRDHIYASEEENGRLYQNYQTAIAWLPTLDFPNDPDKAAGDSVEAILKEYRTRIALHNIKRAIGTYDWEAVIGQAIRMGSASLFEGFRTRNADVAFNLYQQYFERYRFRYGLTTEIFNEEKHKYEKLDKLGKPGIEGIALDRITPEIVYEIRQKVTEELKKNRDLYGFKTEKDAETASRIGFNVFRASQRMGVHTARGRTTRAAMQRTSEEYRELRKEEAFVTDPEELLVNLYNPWQFQIEKWTRYGKPQYAIYGRILDMLGDGDREVGEREMVDILKIVDYFSSGWRLGEAIEGSLEKRIRLTGNNWKIRKESLVTGFRLHRAMSESDEEKNEEKKKNALKTVARFRPLELAKAYVVNVDEKGKRYTTGERQKEFEAMLEKGDLKTSNQTAIKNYIKLEQVLGRYIYPIYNQMLLLGWDKIRGIDIGGASQQTVAGNPFAQEDYEIIERIMNHVNSQTGIPANEKLNSVSDLQTIYKKLQEFLSSEKTIEDLRVNSKHKHLYQKTLYLDDAPLGKLEEQEVKVGEGKNQRKYPMIPVSKVFNDLEGGRRDPYARIWGDTQSAFTTHEHLANAMSARDHNTLVKEIMELSGPLAGYAGKSAFLKLATNVAAGWLDLARADMVWGTVGLAGKVPWATSEFERLFGLGAPSMTREQIKGVCEQIKLIFGDFKSEPGGKELEKKIESKLGIESYKVILSAAKLVAFVVLLALIQEILKEQEKEE